MAKKKIELFIEVHSDKELQLILQKNMDKLICTEVYCEFAGQCTALDRLFTKIKFEISDGSLLLLKASADEVETFQRFRGLSEPMYIFIYRHRITKVFRGVDAIKIAHVAKMEIEYHRREKAGEDLGRLTYNLDEVTPEEQEWHELLKTELEKEAKVIDILRSSQTALRKKRRAELMVPHLLNLNFVLFWPHAKHAHVELYERWDMNEIIMVGREDIQLDEYKARDILYAGDAPINEASMHALLAGQALAICFRYLGSGNFVALVRRILYQDIPPLDPAKPKSDQPIQKTAFDQYKSYSPTREEVWRRRREEREKKQAEIREKRTRRLSEMQRLARQAFTEKLDARKHEREQHKLHLLKSGNIAALEELKQQTDDEDVDITVPEELYDEEEELEEVIEDENEYFPPPGLVVPGFYAPPNDIAKVNGLAILFEKLVREAVTPEPEFLPPHVLVMLQIEKRHSAVRALIPHKSSVIHMGIFKATCQLDAVHIAFSVKQYDAIKNGFTEDSVMIAFMISLKTDLPLLELMDLAPAHVSRDACAGELECSRLFPVYYCHEQEFEDFVTPDSALEEHSL